MYIFSTDTMIMSLWENKGTQYFDNNHYRHYRRWCTFFMPVPFKTLSSAVTKATDVSWTNFHLQQSHIIKFHQLLLAVRGAAQGVACAGDLKKIASSSPKCNANIRRKKKVKILQGETRVGTKSHLFFLLKIALNPPTAPKYKTTRSRLGFFTLNFQRKGWGLSVKLGKHSAIWGKLGTALQAYTLKPYTKFPPNPTSRKVNT